MQQPQCCLIFQITVTAFGSQEESTELGNAEDGSPALWFFLKHPCRQGPMPNRTHHVLADSETHDGVVASKDLWIRLTASTALVSQAYRKTNVSWPLNEKDGSEAAGEFTAMVGRLRGRIVKSPTAN